jgi:hypothetical protein
MQFKHSCKAKITHQPSVFACIRFRYCDKALSSFTKPSFIASIYPLIFYLSITFCKKSKKGIKKAAASYF